MRGIGANLQQVPSQEHLPTLDLRALFMKVLVQWCFVCRVPRVECSRRDVGFQELFVDNVHDRGDQGFDVLGT